MNIKSLSITATLYAEALRDLSDTTDALEDAQGKLKRAEEELSALRSTNDGLRSDLARVRTAPRGRPRKG